MNLKIFLSAGFLAVFVLGAGVYVRFARQHLSIPIFPRASNRAGTTIYADVDWPLWTSVWGWTMRYPKEWNAQGNEPSGVDFSTCPASVVRCFEKGQAQIRISSRYNTPELKKIDEEIRARAEEYQQRVGMQPQTGTRVTVAGLDAMQVINRGIREDLRKSYGPPIFMDTVPEGMSDNNIVTSFEKGNLNVSIVLEGDIDKYRDVYDAMIASMRFTGAPAAPMGEFEGWKAFRRWGFQFYYPPQWVISTRNEQTSDEAVVTGEGYIFTVRSNKGWQEFPSAMFRKVKIRIGDSQLREDIMRQWHEFGSFWVDGFEAVSPPQGKSYALKFILKNHKEQGQYYFIDISVDASILFSAAKERVQKVIGTGQIIPYQFYYE